VRKARTASTLEAEAAKLARGIGYPVMLKASWGGGGRGMRVIEGEAHLAEMVAAARREAKAAFGNDEVYLEKLVRRARHVEVQILGDRHGNLVHLFERDCTVQRRNQKVVERAPAVFLDDAQREALCQLGLRIGRAVNYLNAGTVEFLQDADTGQFYFIEVNPRIQVEHTVTEVVTGIDIVKAQVRIAEGAAIGTPASGVPAQSAIRMSGHAMQCRVTSEDPENNFIPDYGRITAYRSPAGFGIRLDAGTAYTGAFITRSYDSLLVKVTAWAPAPDETIARMHRALQEFRGDGRAANRDELQRARHGPAALGRDHEQSQQFGYEDQAVRSGVRHTAEQAHHVRTGVAHAGGGRGRQYAARSREQRRVDAAHVLQQRRERQQAEVSVDAERGRGAGE